MIKFPGGHVEISRTSDGKYWAHLAVDEAANVVESRIDYDHEHPQKHRILSISDQDKIDHMAIMVDGPFKSNETL